MIELKPNCEICDQNLPPDSGQARICTYECTFCADCVEELLHNVCPNCGGGFVPRPIRPKQEHRPGVSIAMHPASAERVHSKYTREEMAIFCASIKHLDPELR